MKKGVNIGEKDLTCTCYICKCQWEGDKGDYAQVELLRIKFNPLTGERARVLRGRETFKKGLGIRE